MKLKILSRPKSLAKEFADCCRRYNRLELAVAWCGDPAKNLPYAYLEDFRGTIHATIGTAFNHTHPDSFVWLGRLENAHVRVFRDDSDLFHPKVYMFSRGNRYALFTGSSNLTYGGFCRNIEVNVVLEGQLSGSGSAEVARLRERLAEWRTDRFSFVPSLAWLDNYRKKHATSTRNARKYSLKSESVAEDEIASASWLRNADWNVYYAKVVGGVRHYEGHHEGIRAALHGAEQLLGLPWKVSYFSDIKRRRVINGIGDYASLGHVGASGAFQHLIAKGSLKQHGAIVKCINAIATLPLPVPWARLESALRELVNLGPTMKVWGRLLCITRPDLFCTVAAMSVRSNLSEVLGIPQTRFAEVEGYVKLIQLVHASPWFNSPKPIKKGEADIWARRVAFMDVIFY